MGNEKSPERNVNQHRFYKILRGMIFVNAGFMFLWPVAFYFVFVGNVKIGLGILMLIAAISGCCERALKIYQQRYSEDFAAAKARAAQETMKAQVNSTIDPNIQAFHKKSKKLKVIADMVNDEPISHILKNTLEASYKNPDQAFPIGNLKNLPPVVLVDNTTPSLTWNKINYALACDWLVPEGTGYGIKRVGHLDGHPIYAYLLNNQSLFRFARRQFPKDRAPAQDGILLHHGFYEPVPLDASLSELT